MGKDYSEPYLDPKGMMVFGGSVSQPVGCSAFKGVKM